MIKGEEGNKSSSLVVRYEPSIFQGQCTLKSITPICLSSVKFAVFSFFSILFIGLPFVIAQWFPKLQIWLYYAQCTVQESTHFSILNSDDQTTIAKKQESKENKNDKTSDSQKKQKDNVSKNNFYFINRYMKYNVDPQQNCFRVKPNIFSYQHYIQKILSNFLVTHKILGYKPVQVEDLRQNFGPGCMIVEKPTIKTLFFREIIKPLYLFLVFTAVVWCLETYYYYLLVIVITTLAGLIANLYQSYSINKKIYQMAYHEVELNALRQDSIIKISSRQIVPGDIVFLKDCIKIPFDGLILEGSALMNECALTGQSAPIVRKAQDIYNLLERLSQAQQFHIQAKNNLVCEGTSLIQVDNKKKMQLFQRYRQAYGIPVCVIRTNFVTVKGQLIRIISFPLEKRNIFEKQSVKFLFFMFFLSCLSYTMLIFRLKDYIRFYILALKFCDLITVAVPPGLPVSMTFGAIHAVEKLKKKNIFCISPNKIINGGFVDLICFDKTGTLTEDFMDLKCIVPAVQGEFKQPIQNAGSLSVSSLNINKIIKQNPKTGHIMTNIATNHSIVKIQRTNQNVGDPMQVKLFQFGQYYFTQAKKTLQLLKENQKYIFAFQSQRGHYGVLIRRQQFDSQLLRTSSIARSSLKEGFGQLFLYTKGSPEAIKKICNPSTLPQNYDQVLKDYASSGFRVLSIAHKNLDKQKLLSKRVQIQQDMTFDGFLIFENKLKIESKPAMIELLQAQIPCVMITGDHALTACNLSYKCGISNIKKKLYIADYNKQTHLFEIEEFFYKSGNGQNQEIQNNEQQNEFQNYQIQQNKELELKEKESQNAQYQQNQSTLQGIKQISQLISDQRTEICLTGAAFRVILVQSDVSAIKPNIKKILKHTKIYARTTPNDKTRIVRAYQHYLGKVVAMCGDGANDCGALKQSDAGLSISQTEASISAPFTSKIPNITSMVELIKQCRAGLVTNFSLFNIMALYALIQSTTTVITQYYFCFPSDMGLFYWDFCGNFLFFMVFGFTETSKKLTSQRTSFSLFTFTNISQIIVMHLLQMGGQILMIISVSSFFGDETNYNENGGTMVNYQKYKNNNENFSTVCIENSACLLFSNLMYIFSFAAFSISKPWKKSIFTNISFLVLFIIFTLYSILMIVVPQVRLEAFYIIGFDNKMVNFYTLLVTLVFAFVIYFNQKVIMQTLAIKLRKMYPNKKWL